MLQRLTDAVTGEPYLLDRHTGRQYRRTVCGADCQTKVDTKNTPSSLIFSTVVL